MSIEIMRIVSDVSGGYFHKPVLAVPLRFRPAPPPAAGGVLGRVVHLDLSRPVW
jgi:hypothetical protein